MSVLPVLVMRFGASLSPDWSCPGVRPKYAPASRALPNRLGSEMCATNAQDVTGPTLVIVCRS